MKVQGPYANRGECQYCASNVNGRCKTLRETRWMKPRIRCPFLATDRRLMEDRIKLDKAIREGRVDPAKYE